MLLSKATCMLSGMLYGLSYRIIRGNLEICFKPQIWQLVSLAEM